MEDMRVRGLRYSAIGIGTEWNLVENALDMLPQKRLQVRLAPLSRAGEHLTDRATGDHRSGRHLRR